MKKKAALSPERNINASDKIKIDINNKNNLSFLKQIKINQKIKAIST